MTADQSVLSALSDLGIDVHLGPVAASLEGVSASGVLWQAAQGRFLLAVPGVGRYLVEGGATIAVDPDGTVALSASATVP